MVRKELKLRPNAHGQGLAAELAILSVEMRDAFWAAIGAYEVLGVRFVVCGGIAAGSYGEPRATKDIDFLVGNEAFKTAGPIISFAVPLPLQAYGVAIDPIPLPENARRCKVLDYALDHPHADTTTGKEVLLLSATALAYMKLASPRSKDRADIVSMMTSGAVDVAALEEMVGGDLELRARLTAAEDEAETAA